MQIFITDLHGSNHRYQKLSEFIIENKPEVVYWGGDLQKHYTERDFLANSLRPYLENLKQELKSEYPKIFLILGNDDTKLDEEEIKKLDQDNLISYVHNKSVIHGQNNIFGYNYVPPTPFMLKDWERYDVSRYVDPGAISPEEGPRTVAVPEEEIKFSTIQKDLELLSADNELKNSIWLFHSPPYKTVLDRAALDGKMIDHVPLDVHVGSIAIKKFIAKKQPLLTLHGHVHESTSITGEWKEKIGRTYCFNAAHQGSELSLIKFDLHNLENAQRILI